ncbi:hypothetical protein K438DRAFT_1937472, partial [Mycena galopus ATCC 62051]
MEILEGCGSYSAGTLKVSGKLENKLTLTITGVPDDPIADNQFVITFEGEMHADNGQSWISGKWANSSVSQFEGRIVLMPLPPWIYRLKDELLQTEGDRNWRSMWKFAQFAVLRHVRINQGFLPVVARPILQEAKSGRRFLRVPRANFKGMHQGAELTRRHDVLQELDQSDQDERERLLFSLTPWEARISRCAARAILDCTIHNRQFILLRDKVSTILWAAARANPTGQTPKHVEKPLTVRPSNLVPRRRVTVEVPAVHLGVVEGPSPVDPHSDNLGGTDQRGEESKDGSSNIQTDVERTPRKNKLPAHLLVEENIEKDFVASPLRRAQPLRQSTQSSTRSKFSEMSDESEGEDDEHSPTLCIYCKASAFPRYWVCLACTQPQSEPIRICRGCETQPRKWFLGVRLAKMVQHHD